MAAAQDAFPSDYYVLKEPVPTDYTVLAEYSKSSNRSTSVTSALILGYYYLRDGDIRRARPLIAGHYNDSGLDGYMIGLGKLWMMELAVADGDHTLVRAWASDVHASSSDANIVKALNSYCDLNNLYPSPASDPFSCVVTRLTNFGVTLPFSGTAVSQNTAGDESTLPSASSEQLSPPVRQEILPVTGIDQAQPNQVIELADNATTVGSSAAETELAANNAQSAITDSEPRGTESVFAPVFIGSELAPMTEPEVSVPVVSQPGIYIPVFPETVVGDPIVFDPVYGPDIVEPDFTETGTEDFIPYQENYGYGWDEYTEPPLEGPIPYNAGYSGDLSILVTGSGNMFDRAGGIYYYLRKRNLNYMVRTSREYVEGEWDFWIDLDRGLVSGMNMLVNFMPSVEFFLDDLGKYVDLRTCRNVLIGSSGLLRAKTSEVASELKSQVSRVSTVDISGTNVARSIRQTLEPVLEMPFCALGFGTEAQINNFVPTVRQYITRPSVQKIYMFLNADSGANYSSNYRQYYLNSNLFTVIEYNLSEKSSQFAAGYQAYSGKPVSLDVLLGYDMIDFIYKMSIEGSTDPYNEPYVTNITGFDMGSAVREISAFHINQAGIAEPIALDGEVIMSH